MCGGWHRRRGGLGGGEHARRGGGGWGSMTGPGLQKIKGQHREHLAVVYLRQSSPRQVRENFRSTERQYGLAEEAVKLGWEPERVVTIDGDLGVSGRDVHLRGAYKELVGRVCLGEVGAIFGLEVSRLARSSAETQRLLEYCGLTDTLVIDTDGIYDLRDFNDQLILGVKGQLAQAELHMMGVRLQLGLDSQYPRLGLIGRWPRSVGIHRRPPDIPVPPCELAASLRHVDGSPVLGLLRRLRPATTPSADDEPSLGRTARLAVGSVATVPMFTVNRLTGWASSCAPAASPRVRRRLSSWPPRQPSRAAFGDDRRVAAGDRALRPGPDPPGFEPVRVLRSFNHWFTCVTPLCLARRTPAIWRCWPVPALSGLLPPDPASPESGCPPLHRTAATARRWGSTPHAVQRRLMAHDELLEVAGGTRIGAGERHLLDPHAVLRTLEPAKLRAELQPPHAEVQVPPDRLCTLLVVTVRRGVAAERADQPTAPQREPDDDPVLAELNIADPHPAEPQQPRESCGDAHVVLPCELTDLEQPPACRTRTAARHLILTGFRRHPCRRATPSRSAPPSRRNRVDPDYDFHSAAQTPNTPLTPRFLRPRDLHRYREPPKTPPKRFRGSAHLATPTPVRANHATRTRSTP